MRTMMRWSLLALAIYVPLALSTISAGAVPGGTPLSMDAVVSSDEQSVVRVRDWDYRSYSDDDDDDDDFDDPPPRRSYGYGYYDRPVIPPAPVYGSYGYAAPRPAQRYYEPPVVEWLPPPRPSSCGQYRYWDGERCADARRQPPYIGPRW